jgi:serine/threonine protein kinase
MEYVEGQTLATAVAGTLGQIFDIVLQCAQNLAVSHPHGVVHCDIKPENILLTTDGQVKILDFGVATRLPCSDQSITLEKSQTLSGTPDIWPPRSCWKTFPTAVLIWLATI